LRALQTIERRVDHQLERAPKAADKIQTDCTATSTNEEIAAARALVPDCLSFLVEESKCKAVVVVAEGSFNYLTFRANSQYTFEALDGDAPQCKVTHPGLAPCHSPRPRPRTSPSSSFSYLV